MRLAIKDGKNALLLGIENAGYVYLNKETTKVDEEMFGVMGAGEYDERVAERSMMLGKNRLFGDWNAYDKTVIDTLLDTFAANKNVGECCFGYGENAPYAGVAYIDDDGEVEEYYSFEKKEDVPELWATALGEFLNSVEAISDMHFLEWSLYRGVARSLAREGREFNVENAKARLDEILESNESVLTLDALTRWKLACESGRRMADFVQALLGEGGIDSVEAWNKVYQDFNFGERYDASYSVKNLNKMLEDASGRQEQLMWKLELALEYYVASLYEEMEDGYPVGEEEAVAAGRQVSQQMFGRSRTLCSPVAQFEGDDAYWQLRDIFDDLGQYKEKEFYSLEEAGLMLTTIRHMRRNAEEYNVANSNIFYAI